MNLVSAVRMSVMLIVGIKTVREGCQVLFAAQTKLVMFYCVELFKFSASRKTK